MNSQVDSKNSILVYIHGFLVSFDDAIRRAAQIAVDFNYQGAPIAFSWPSDGQFGPRLYNSDSEDVLWSVKHIKNFLLDVSEKFPGRQIHIVSHSMGNKGLLYALRLIANEKLDNHPKFKSIVLCAPDIDAELFSDQIAKEVNDLGLNWVIYTSDNDYALKASALWNLVPRLGTPTTVVDNMQVIDASNLEVTPWSVPETHSYYATKKKVIDDMIGVINGIDPEKRRLVKKRVQSGVIWEFE